MKLDKLIEELAGLQRAGYGGRRVIDDNGNDVAQVSAPLVRSKDDDLEDDADAVMLSCYIERAAS